MKNLISKLIKRIHFLCEACLPNYLGGRNVNKKEDKMKSINKRKLKGMLMAVPIAMSMGMINPVWGFDSGSTGADGPFNPIVDTEVALPPDGIFNYTSVNIPTGVTVTFARNTTNTPVVWLVSGDVTIDGQINLNGGVSTSTGAAGDGNLGDDGLPGLGGPGGFDGGKGGSASSTVLAERYGAYGLGPGGGEGSQQRFEDGRSFGCGGGGGAHGSNGAGAGVSGRCDDENPPNGGTGYGSASLLPLIGGSGGGGGAGGTNFSGSGGGGGGGAILIAVSGTVTINGSINANGGVAANTSGVSVGGPGGGGAGGAIRIIATTLSGNGAINAFGASGGNSSCQNNRCRGGAGGTGRVKLEAETNNRTAGTNPSFLFTGPQDIFVSGMPMLVISSVAGVAAPANPTGNADIVLPDTTANPVTVEFTTTNVPLGNTIDLELKAASGGLDAAVSGAIAGTLASGTASTTIDLPDGPSTMAAEVSYTVVADNANAEDYSRYADGEPVERIILRAGMGQQMASTTTFVTESGKEFTWPSHSVVLPN